MLAGVELSVRRRAQRRDLSCSGVHGCLSGGQEVVKARLGVQ